MVLSLEWVQNNLQSLKHRLLSPTLGVSDAGGLGWTRQFVFLTDSQLLLLVWGPHHDDRFFSLANSLSFGKGIEACHYGCFQNRRGTTRTRRQAWCRDGQCGGHVQGGGGPDPGPS